MVQGNDYLLDPAVQQDLMAHDSDLLAQSVPPWPLGAPQPAPTVVFNRKREAEVLDGHLKQFTDIDYRSGTVTVDDAAKVVYGKVDEYLTDRITRTWLKPDSAFNKGQNGQVVIVDTDGQTIIRDDRHAVALHVAQVAADKVAKRAVKTIDSAGKSFGVAKRRALRIAPGAEQGVNAIAAGALDVIAGQAQLALGQGE